jgi:hypothetical protein
VIFAVVALAAALTGTDPATDMTFTLSGRTLTAQIGANTPAKVKARLSGRKVVFVCARISRHSTVTTHKTQLWPAGALGMRVKLPKTLKHPGFCGVEKPGGEDISYAAVD